jgi:hypothetical protein
VVYNNRNSKNNKTVKTIDIIFTFVGKLNQYIYEPK